MKIASILFALSVVAGLSAPAAAQLPDINRSMDAIGIVQTAPDRWNVHAVWTASLLEKAQTTTDLSTDVVLLIGGQEVGRQRVELFAFAEAGGCGSCAPGCGNGIVNGMAAALICLSDGPAGCSCQFPPLTTTFDVEFDAPVEDVAFYFVPVPSSAPDVDPNDDRKAVVFQGLPIAWDRHLERAELVPTPGAPAGVYDIEVEWKVSTSEMLDLADMTPSFEVLVNGDVMFIFEPPCGPWIAAPGNFCIQAECPGGGCATISCGGGAPQQMKCTLTENAVGLQYCACLMPNACLEVVPGLTFLDPENDVIEIVMVPVPGSLPELPELKKDNMARLEVASPWTDLGFALGGVNGSPELSPEGSMQSGTKLTLQLKNAEDGAKAWLIVSPFQLNAPFKGGVLVPDPTPPGLTLFLPTDAEGQALLEGELPVGLPSGFELNAQWWIQDAAGPASFSASNAVRGVTP